MAIHFDDVAAAAGDRVSGATEIALHAIAALLPLSGDRESLTVAARMLLEGQPSMAPIRRVAGAATGARPAEELRELRDQIENDRRAAPAVAAAWIREHGRSVRTTSHSSLVVSTLALLDGDDYRGSLDLAVLGADAIGPDYLINAAGSLALAREFPTVVVTTSAVILSGDQIGALRHGDEFERVPLEAIRVFVVGPAVLPDRRSLVGGTT
jgi:hypothetical protein